MEELKTNTKVVKEKNNTKEKVDKMLKSIKFRKIKLTFSKDKKF